MITFQKIKHDVNGNPRYVCHYLNLNTDHEKAIYFMADKVFSLYKIAVMRSHKIGGRKYHTKAFGGGIVFQSYSIHELESDINKLLVDAEQMEQDNG